MRLVSILSIVVLPFACWAALASQRTAPRAALLFDGGTKLPDLAHAQSLMAQRIGVEDLAEIRNLPLSGAESRNAVAPLIVRNPFLAPSR